MAEAALILSSPAAAPSARAVKPVQDNGSLEGEGASSGFSDLLEAIEQVAAEGQEVDVAEAGIALPATAQNSLLSTVVSKHRALGGQGQPAQQRVTPFSEIRPLLTPTDRMERTPVNPALKDGLNVQAYLTRAQGNLTPAQIAALTAVEDAQLPPQQQQGGESALPKLETQIAATPKIEATLAQGTSGETSNPVVRQVAANLQYVARGEMERMRIDLHPEELGRVQVQLQKSGTLTRVVVVTETAQAFEALKAGVGGLQQSLSQAGFEADEVRFESREDRENGRQAEADERQDRREGREARDDAEERRELIVRTSDFTGRTVLL